MTFTNLTRIGLLGIVFCCASNMLTAQEPLTVSTVAETYQIGKDGRPIVLPVTIHEEEYQFLLDTGAGRSHFDQSLRPMLGPELDAAKLKTPSGMQQVIMYSCPQAFVGSFPVHDVQSVACTDLSRLRYATGLEIKGILGADFCFGKRIAINFDNGTITISTPSKKRASPWKDGESFPVSIVAGVPQIAVELPGGCTTALVVDTGANRTTLCADVFDTLVGSGDIEVIATRRSVSLYDIQLSRLGRLSTLKLGSVQLEDVQLERDGLSLLALDQLSRFELCLDLQQNQLTLRNGRGFDRPTEDATSGLSIVQHAGAKVVVGVKNPGPAVGSGIKAGDEIVSVNGVAASELDMFNLREILTHGVGKMVELEVDRGHRLIPVSLKLSRVADH